MSDLLLVLLGASVPIIIWIAAKFLDVGKEKLSKIKTYSIDKRNKQKEITLLNELLQDIRDNTHNWIYTGYNHSSMANMSIINDVKNVAIITGEGTLLRTTASIAVIFGLKDITKYRHNDDNNISVHIEGKHVIDFCIQVEEALDSRGHELDLFKKQIKNKL